MARVRRIETAEDIPGGLAALGAIGDYLLSNDQITAVLDDLDHPHYLAPTGGALLDLATNEGNADSMRHTFQATGVLPEEAVEYTEARTFSEDGLAAVQFRGHLFGRPDMRVATRYEIRACEPGLRVRTEIVHLETDPQSISLADGYYFGDRELLPFTPTPNGGFDQPSFGLSTLGGAIKAAPYLVAAGHTEPATSYATIACNHPELIGFQSENVAANGMPPTVVMPRDYVVFERFFAAADGAQVADAGDLALEVRRQLFGEPWVSVSGRLEQSAADLPLDQGLRAAVHVIEVDPEADLRRPWSQTRPAADGRWSVRVPADRDYAIEVESYGRIVATGQVAVGRQDTDAGSIDLPAVGSLVIDATVDGAPDYAKVLVRPANKATEDAVRGSMFGQFLSCAPLLGPPFGGSPACDRVIVKDATALGLHPGRYDIVATAGPFTTLGTALEVEVVAGQQTPVSLSLTTLPIQPPGTLSADLHVHGTASFDAGIPDEDRVRSFLAARTQVIAATDHDALGTYEEAMDALAAHDRMEVMVGMETTGHILFKLVPDAPFPQVIGHWNLWPIPYDPTAPYRGAPWDELMHPGELMTRAEEAGWPAETGIAQLNHPLDLALFARDLGWVKALGIDGNQPLPTEYDGSLASTFLWTPPGSAFSNADYHAQEVMNGTANRLFQAHRAFWFYLLDQGIVRAGTANSDSHSLSDSVLGTPRNLVWTDTTVGSFDDVEFNAAVRAGRILGTNGPVIEAHLEDPSGGRVAPSTAPVIPAPDSQLRIQVRAAPWVPVDEVRVVVNGEVVRTITEALSHPADPLGNEGLQRLDTVIPLDELVTGEGDAWIVVEAGRALPPGADLDCDGFPDTGDNNGDGRVDWRDVDGLEEDPETDCLAESGPLGEWPPTLDRSDPDFLFERAVPEGYPLAFTNPFVLDRDGGGFSGAGR
jgi:hypothetical protein